MFCEKCAPLVEQERIKARDEAKKDWQESLKKFSDLKADRERLELAASDATKLAEGKDKEIADLRAKVAKYEENEKGLVAAADAMKLFDERKARYPAEKHPELQRILFRLVTKTHTPEDVLNLTDWQSSTKGNELTIAGSPPPVTGPKLTDEEIDATFTRHMGKSGYRVYGGKP